MKEEGVSSFDSHKSVESNKRHKLSDPIMHGGTIPPNHEKMASVLQRAWRNIFKNRRSQMYAQCFLNALTMDHVKSIRLVYSLYAANSIGADTLCPVQL